MDDECSAMRSRNRRIQQDLERNKYRELRAGRPSALLAGTGRQSRERAEAYGQANAWLS